MHRYVIIYNAKQDAGNNNVPASCLIYRKCMVCLQVTKKKKSQTPQKKLPPHVRLT